jgi:cbb3-type cytochrome oxidase maturation protein
MSYFFLIPVSIALGLTGLGAFFWSLRHDQYDDLDGAAVRILSATDKHAPVPHPAADKTEAVPRSKPLDQIQ